MRAMVKSENVSIYDTARRTVSAYIAVLLGLVLVFGLVHWFFGDFRTGRIAWFNLDKERNIPTWFSGVLFFLFGCSTFVAFYWEKHRNATESSYFRLPILWLGVGMAGLFLSLDEITILHENIYWREIRHISGTFGDAWKYMTQWQILFAPAIVLILCYFILFFHNRFKDSRDSRIAAYTGMGCWLLALSIEGVRETVKLSGPGWYSLSVLFEEMLEMNGTIFLTAAVVFYGVDIAFDFTKIRRTRCLKPSKFFTIKATAGLAVIVLFLSGAGAMVYFFSQRLAASKHPLPRLYLKAQRPSQSPPISTRQQVTSETENRTSKIRFKDIQNPIAISDTDGKTLLKAIAESLYQKEETRIDLPEVFSRDSSPRIVFLSISNGNSPARIYRGAGKGINRAIKNALYRFDRKPGTSRKPLWIKLDIVQDVIPIAHQTFQQPLMHDRSLYGIAFAGDSEIAFLPEELVSHTLIDRKGRIRSKKIDRYLRQRHTIDNAWSNLSVKQRIFRFTTTGFFAGDERIHRLYRGHRIFNHINGDQLLSAASRGGNYLIRATGPDGRFDYIYYPHTDRVPAKYNLIRHAGTIYAMVELYEITQDQSLLQAIERAMGYLLKQIKTCSLGGETVSCVIEKDYVKLGGNALAAVALAKYTEVTQDRKHVPALLKLGRWIQHAQASTGEFIVQKQRYSDGRIIDIDSQYYPGEALLAMVRIHRLVPRTDWLDTAEKGARFLIRVRDHGVPDTSLTHDHWLLYALNELYRHRPDPLYLAHAFRIAGAILRSQNRNPEYPDWLGSYYKPPRSTPTATRSEGLSAAYRLANDYGSKSEAEKILDAIQLGIAFQLQTQTDPESALYFKNPQRASGGFKRSLTNPEIRIDYVQHNISSLLGLYRILSGQP
jgi:hypothetical protein